MSGLCFMHNPGEQPPARYLMLVPIGNELLLCVDCCAWWRAEAAANPDDAALQPVWIRSLEPTSQTFAQLRP